MDSGLRALLAKDGSSLFHAPDRTIAIPLCHAARRCEKKRKGQIRRGFGQHRRSMSDGDAESGCRLQIDVVHTHRDAGNHAKVRSGREGLGVDRIHQEAQDSVGAGKGLAELPAACARRAGHRQDLDTLAELRKGAVGKRMAH